jgi:hypothetical protein
MENFDIIYRDSDGIIDGVHTNSGMFCTFYPIREADFYAAKLKVKANPLPQPRGARADRKEGAEEAKDRGPDLDLLEMLSHDVMTVQGELMGETDPERRKALEAELESYKGQIRRAGG